MPQISDSMLLTMLRAVGAGKDYRISINNQTMQALFVSEFQRVELDEGVVVESHDPMLICLASDFRRLQIQKDDIVYGLPEDFRVKEHDAGDKTEIVNGQYGGLQLVMLRRL